MHDEVGVWNFCMDLFDAANGKNVACWRAAELVSAVACAHCDSERVDAGGVNKVFSFLRVGEHLGHRQNAFGANAVFFAGHAGFERAQATDFAFDRNTAGVCHGNSSFGYRDVIVEVHRGLAVFAK